jgi:putative hydrolase of the HAD superfamily
MNQAASVRAVTFDVGGTLIEPWPSVGSVYVAVAAEHGVDGLSPETLDRNFAAAWRERKAFRHERHQWAQLVDRTFAGLVEVPPSRSFFRAVYERFGQPDAWRVHDDVRPLLERLASRGVPLGAISNWDERLRPLLSRLNLDRFFRSVVVSCEVGDAKPSPVLFQTAARSLGFEPGHILHVGDSFEEDVMGARAAGFQALLVGRGVASVPGERLASLAELELVF